MNLAIVRNTITGTVKHPVYAGRRLYVVEICTPDWRPTGKETIAVDTVQAGVGDRVLVLKEGNSARAILKEDLPPLQEMIVAIVDHVSLVGQQERGSDVPK